MTYKYLVVMATRPGYHGNYTFTLKLAIFLCLCFGNVRDSQEICGYSKLQQGLLNIKVEKDFLDLVPYLKNSRPKFYMLPPTSKSSILWDV